MTEPFWFNRMAEHWSIPQRLDLISHVKRAGLQLVQIGTFGPIFYGLADDPYVARSWAGMPLVGVRENLMYAAALIPELQAAGTRVVGQMSMSWHYGDHTKRLGWFAAWDSIWTESLLGPAPCPHPWDGHQLKANGELRCWPIEGRPYLTYAGCICNPNWMAILKPMIRKAIDLGLDGFNVHHNFESFCACSHCQAYVRKHLTEHLDNETLKSLYGNDELTRVGDVVTVREDWPDTLRQRFLLERSRAAALRRKQAFDELFIQYGRALKPGLLLAQWYHKYDFGPSDERSLLPSPLWAKDEDYIWYSQGAHKGLSFIEHGYLADTGLAARFVYAAGGGRPFVLNKYDYRRWRLSIAEAAANHGAALGYHWNQDDNRQFALEDYYAPVIRYQTFLTKYQHLIHPAQPWSQVGLVYPRRGEQAGDASCLDALRRVGGLLEDAHILFDMLLDEQIVQRAHQYDTLVLPDIMRLSTEEGEALRSHVAEGGKLALIGRTAVYQPDGSPYPRPLQTELSASGGDSVFHIPKGAWSPLLVEPQLGVRVQTYPPIEEDSFAQTFLRELKALLQEPVLRTNAPWYVRARAWQPTKTPSLVLHWVNYHQDEAAEIEVPIPTGPIHVELTVPGEYSVESVQWLYPEMAAPKALLYESKGSQVSFEIPSVIVYGLAVLHLRPG